MALNPNQYSFRIEIQVNDDEFDNFIAVEVGKLDIDIQKSISARLNTANIALYNLSQNQRRQIEVDRITVQDQQSVLSSGGTQQNKVYRKCLIYAGFEGNMPLLFSGNILQAYSEKKGVDVVTNIQVMDGLYCFQNSYSNFTLQPASGGSVSFATVIERLLQDLKNVNVSNQENINLSVFDGLKFTRPYTIAGSTSKALQTLTKGMPNNINTYSNYFIDNESVFILPNLAGVVSTILKLDGDLILSTAPSETTISIRTKFFPQLLCGQIIEIASLVNVFLNGVYKIVSVKHSGCINQVGDPANMITTIEVWRGINGMIFEV